MKKLVIVLFLSLVGQVLISAQSDTATHIKAWGTEPFWEFEMADSSATFKINDKQTTFKLSERVGNSGFSNENVDTYIFKSATNQVLNFTLVVHSECSCGYDMSEGEHKVSAILHLESNGKHEQYLGCVKIFHRN